REDERDHHHEEQPQEELPDGLGDVLDHRDEAGVVGPEDEVGADAENGPDRQPDQDTSVERRALRRIRRVVPEVRREVPLERVRIEHRSRVHTSTESWPGRGRGYPENLDISPRPPTGATGAAATRLGASTEH